MNKLQIFHQPHRTHPDFWDSVTLSFYDYDEEKNTYKSKIVCELRGQTFKRKELRDDLPVLAEKLAKLDFANRSLSKVARAQSYFYIKYGDVSITTGSANEIQDILDLFGFQTALDMFNEYLAKFPE